MLVQQNVKTNSMESLKYVRYNREIVIMVNIYVSKISFGSQKVELYSFVITVITEFDFSYICTSSEENIIEPINFETL